MTIKRMFENSFSCVCPVINNEFRHNIVKVVRNQILQGTANDKRCQRRIYKRSDQLKKCKISDTLRFLKHGSGHAMFKCLGWPCPATFIFCFRDTNRDTLVFLRPETRDVATRVSGRKWVQSAEFDIVNGSFCNLCKLAPWLPLHVFATQCWRAPTRAKQLSTVAILLCRFLSCWCLETLFHVVSALQSCLSK